jgi:hypothetical protein
MPYYLSKTPDQDSATQKQGWTQLAKYVRSIDPFSHLITIHPSRTARDSVEDPGVLDFDMLQTGHDDRRSIPNTIKLMTGSVERTPAMPVLDGEVCYEGVMAASREEVQRFMFWACILSGAAGHTYGANGIWQANNLTQRFGPSPHGHDWGDTPWEVAYQLPGSGQLGLSKGLLSRYPWWRFEPHPEWVEPHWTPQNYVLPYAAGVPREVRITYLPAAWDPPKMTKLNDGANYRAFYFDPATGKQYDVGRVTPDANGDWKLPVPSSQIDWVIVLEKTA